MDCYALYRVDMSNCSSCWACAKQSVNIYVVTTGITPGSPHPHLQDLLILNFIFQEVLTLPFQCFIMIIKLNTKHVGLNV